MKSSEFQLRVIGDPRLAVHAAAAAPAWLWSVDGRRILWANPVGARFFGAANSTELAEKSFGPAEPHRRQIARLAGTLPPNGAMRLERLRGFGAPLGTLMTCGCAHLEFPDGSQGILVAATQAFGRGMSLIERLQRLVDGVPGPVAVFAQDGMFIGASEAARCLLGLRDLSEAGLDQARNDALKQGRVELPIGIGHLVLQRVGCGADIGLVALISPGATQAAHAARHIPPAPAAPDATPPEAVQEAPVAPPRPLPDYERPAISGQAPAESALFDEFSEPIEMLKPEPSSAPRPFPAADPAVEIARAVQAAHHALADAAAPVEIARAAAPSPEEEPPMARHRPLRFVWQADVDGRFVLGSDEFMRLIGSHTAARFGRPWQEIAASLDLDPLGRINAALASRNTFANIPVDWPADGDERLPIELSGIPVYDRMRNFAGYKGFGVCRDLDGLNRLEALRRFELFSDPATAQALSADVVKGPAEPDAPPGPGATEATAPAELPIPENETEARQNDLEEPAEAPQNVVLFRPLGEAKSPTLTPVENHAFNELARQLSERLERELEEPAPAEPQRGEANVAAEPSAEPPRQAPEWMQPVEPPPRGSSQRDRALFDLLPNGVLIYRLDRLLYANAAFLERMGYPSLHALEDAGGLDALYVEPGVSSASSTSEAGTPVTIAASRATEAQSTSVPTEARLHTISWDGDSALALICAPPQPASAPPAPEPLVAEAAPEPPAVETDAAGHAYAEDLAAILDTTAEGIIMFDAQGGIHACNRSAEALFGYDGEELARFNLADLFAPESQHVVRDYLDSIKGRDLASLLEHSREVLGRERKGGVIPLSMTMGRTRPDGPNFFAVFRDLSESTKGEDEPKRAESPGTANAKADMLARISHELRTPLNAIMGFSEMMIGERFGALGNQRYVEYMKDIRASGQRVISLIDDLLELSRIETGRLELVFAGQNLNDLVERCVTVMQPQANRERIIIRTSLAHALPPVIADARALRQITMNLISNSIRVASPGGQVIVSTALTDGGEIALRVRDTGHGLSDKEVAAAMEPFRNAPPPEQATDSTGFTLSLTKALAEANRARFNIRSAPNSGTLIEVVFSPTLARA